jgi:hypothetical protein
MSVEFGADSDFLSCVWPVISRANTYDAKASLIDTADTKGRTALYRFDAHDHRDLKKG